jgi:hypothetical protein
MHDPRLSRFAEVTRCSHELGTKDVAYVLDCSSAVLHRLCITGEIECSWVSRNDRIASENAKRQARWLSEGGQGTCPNLIKRQRGKKHIWRFTASAVLAHLISHTHPRTLLMDSIREILPKWEAFAQRIASGATVIEARQQTAKKAAKPNALNVIPFDPDHDLFPHLAPAPKAVA